MPLYMELHWGKRKKTEDGKDREALPKEEQTHPIHNGRTAANTKINDLFPIF